MTYSTRVPWLLFLCALALCAVLWILHRYDIARREAALEAAKAETAKERGFSEAAMKRERDLEAQNADLAADLSALRAKGGRVTDIVRIRSGAGHVSLPSPIAAGPPTPEGASLPGTPTVPTPPGSAPGSVPRETFSVALDRLECGLVDRRWFKCSRAFGNVGGAPWIGADGREGLPTPDVAWDVSPAAAAPPRGLLGVDGGLVVGSGAATWELGARWYPAPLALSGRLGEARIGAYGRFDGDGRAGAGVSVLLGVGKR